MEERERGLEKQRRGVCPGRGEEGASNEPDRAQSKAPGWKPTGNNRASERRCEPTSIKRYESSDEGCQVHAALTHLYVVGDVIAHHAECRAKGLCARGTQREAGRRGRESSMLITCCTGC